MNADDFEVEIFTRDEAIQVARAEAVRDLTKTDTLIRYVAFVSDWDDYCQCQFTPYQDGWVKDVRMLLNQERLPDEEITDERILAPLREGNRLSAIRLYRAKYEVGLREAVEGIQALQNQADRR